MRRVLLMLALLGPFLGTAGGAADAPAPPKCVERSGGMRVCSQLDESALSAPGRSTTWRVWLEGGGAPIQVRLHNSSPRVVRVKGGDDQVIHMGCRLHREVRRKVTVVSAFCPARRRLLAISEERPPPRRRPGPDAGADRAISSPAERTPAGPRAQPRRRWSTARGRASRHSGSIAGGLAPTPWPVRQARALRPSARKSSRPLPPRFTAAVYVSLALTAAPSTQPPTTAERILDEVARCIRGLRQMADSNDITTSLCLTSEPTRATFRMRPQSFNQWLSDKLTTGEHRTVFRGLYVYSARKGLKTIRCLDPQRAGCPLRPGQRDEPRPSYFAIGVCQRRAILRSRGMNAGNR